MRMLFYHAVLLFLRAHLDLHIDNQSPIINYLLSPIIIIMGLFAKVSRFPRGDRAADDIDRKATVGRASQRITGRCLQSCE